MPMVLLREWVVSEGVVMSMAELRKRRLDVDENGNKREMSSTAIGFLVPLFALFLLGPFLCVFCVRKRRHQIRHPPVTQTPADRREVARRKLEDVTEVSSVMSCQKSACVGAINEKEAVDTLSILERECTICLSTLYPPSAPEPVKTKSFKSNSQEIGAPIDESVIVKVPTSVSESSSSSASLAEKEEILKLKVCGHEFHAECLISWFVIRKYSCPMCRAVYYATEATEASENGAAIDGWTINSRYAREVV